MLNCWDSFILKITEIYFEPKLDDVKLPRQDDFELPKLLYFEDIDLDSATNDLIFLDFRYTYGR